MEHYIVYRREDRYSSFAQIEQLDDGRLAVTCRSGEYADHFKAILTGKRLVQVSSDEGRTWDESDDPTDRTLQLARHSIWRDQPAQRRAAERHLAQHRYHEVGDLACRPAQGSDPA